VDQISEVVPIEEEGEDIEKNSEEKEASEEDAASKECEVEAVEICV